MFDKHIGRTGKGYCTSDIGPEIKKYLKSLKTMSEPIVPRAKLDLRGIVAYAQSKGVSIEELTREEKDLFISFLEEQEE